MREFDVTAEFAIRDATAEGDGRTIEGLAVPYGVPVRGTTAEYGHAVESFADGAFSDAIAAVERGERVPIVDPHFDQPVGYADKLWSSPDGLRFSGRLFTFQAARDFSERVAGRVVKLSVEFIPGEVKRGLNTVTHTKVKALGAIAGAYFPAYVGTSVSVRNVGGSIVADDQEVTETPEAPIAGPITPAVSQDQMVQIARSITDEAIRSYAARSAFSAEGPVDPFAEFRGLSLGQLAARAVGNREAGYPDKPKREDRAALVRALYASRTIADIVTTSGANAGMVTPGVVGEIHGIVSRGRPAINAFGGPQAVPDESGMSVDWPYFDGTLSALVGAQSAEKAEITSVAVDIKKGTEALATYAGGADVAYQLIRRASRSYLDAYFRILITAWGIVTDAAFVTELESGSVTSDFAEALSAVDATEFKNLLISASIAVETATGQPAEFCLASTTAFTQFAKLLTPIVSMPTITNTGVGGLDLANLRVNVGNIPVIHVPSITAGKLIVSNRLAAAWYEDGPFIAQDEDVLHLGKDVAIWSMGAGTRFIPAGIIEMYDVSP